MEENLEKKELIQKWQEEELGSIDNIHQADSFQTAKEKESKQYLKFKSGQVRQLFGFVFLFRNLQTTIPWKSVEGKGKEEKQFFIEALESQDIKSAQNWYLKAFRIPTVEVISEDFNAIKPIELFRECESTQKWLKRQLIFKESLSQCDLRPLGLLENEAALSRPEYL